MRVVVSDVLSEKVCELTAMKYQHPVDALSADGAHEALGERVRTRGPRRGLDDSDAVRG
jgi:hypothetical protein